jgi:hypothetical protein
MTLASFSVTQGTDKRDFEATTAEALQIILMG